MSTGEGKKRSSSKRSKEDMQSSEVGVEEVHTANDWEHADLGDDQRKQKFLRLMGAKKHKDETRVDRQDSHGSNPDDDASQEKKHSRSKVENDTIERELEKQFNEGLQSKKTHRYHGGLGFHGDTDSAASSSTDWKHESTKTKFVPAKTGMEVSSAPAQAKETKKDEDESNGKDKKSSEKSEKKKKFKS